ncbi:MAG: hypothetical protein RSB71_01820 [Bacilli bacterium]
MKKWLWLLFLMPIFMFKVNAQVYYSDYSNFSEYDTKVVTKNELTNVEQLNKYKWYNEKKVPGEYRLYESSKNFLDDCYETNYSPWSTTVPISHESRFIKQRIKHNYTLANEVRYIHLTNLKGSYDAFRIPELNVKVNNVDLNYTYTCDGCFPNFSEYIHNGISSENESFIKNGGSLIIDLNKSYPVDDLNLIFYIFDLGNTNKEYTLSYSNDKVNTYATKSFTMQFSDEWWDNALKVSHFVYDLGLPKASWTNLVVTNEVINSEYVLEDNKVNEYQYKEKWCRAFNWTKDYAKEYSDKPIANYPIKDLTAFITNYRYQTRDKLELVDSLKITDKTFNLDNFVLNSSKKPFIKHNIDLNKNGFYDITFAIEKFEVVKKIEVDILDNKILEYEQQIADLTKEVASLLDKINVITDDFNSKKTQYEKIIETLNLKIEKLEKKLNDCKQDCNNDKECLNKVIKEKEQLIKEYKDNILELSNKINALQVLLKEKESIINKLLIDNDELSKENQALIKKLDSEIKKIKEESAKLNKDIIDNYNKQLDIINNANNDLKEENTNLEISNETYLKKINELNNNNSVLNQENAYLEVINEVYLKKINELNNMVNKLKVDVKEVSNNPKIISLEKEKVDLENAYNLLSSKFKNQEKEKVNLDSKLNKYLLKINNQEKGGFIIIIILFLILLISCLLYKMQKKSSVKKD